MRIILYPSSGKEIQMNGVKIVMISIVLKRFIERIFFQFGIGHFTTSESLTGLMEFIRR